MLVRMFIIYRAIVSLNHLLRNTWKPNFCLTIHKCCRTTIVSTTGSNARIAHNKGSSAFHIPNIGNFHPRNYCVASKNRLPELQTLTPIHRPSYQRPKYGRKQRRYQHTMYYGLRLTVFVAYPLKLCWHHRLATSPISTFVEITMTSQVDRIEVTDEPAILQNVFSCEYSLQLSVL